MKIKVQRKLNITVQERKPVPTIRVVSVRPGAGASAAFLAQLADLRARVQARMGADATPPRGSARDSDVPAGLLADDAAYLGWVESLRATRRYALDVADPVKLPETREGTTRARAIRWTD